MKKTTRPVPWAAQNGAGDTETTATLNLVCFWFVQIPLGYALATKMPLEADGVFRRGGWKEHEA